MLCVFLEQKTVNNKSIYQIRKTLRCPCSSPDPHIILPFAIIQLLEHTIGELPKVALAQTTATPKAENLLSALYANPNPRSRIAVEKDRIAVTVVGLVTKKVDMKQTSMKI